MLIALIAALLLSGSSGASPLLAAFEQAKASIEAAVPDRARRAQLAALVEDAEKSMKAALKGRAKTIEDLVARIRPHQATTADIQPLLLRLRAEVQAAQAQVVHARFELQERMTREEWQKVFAPTAGSR